LNRAIHLRGGQRAIALENQSIGTGITESADLRQGDFTVSGKTPKLRPRYAAKVAVPR